MKAEQLIFDLASRPALAREDFLIAPCNEQAMSLIDSWPHWSVPVAMIYGPKASGKTHIAQVWQTRANATMLNASQDFSKSLLELQDNFPNAILIDDAQQFFTGSPEAQNFLFHILNEVKNKEGASILMTSDVPPSSWNIDLKDLDSRLKAAQIVEISPPDEMLLMGVFVKQLNDRQLSVDPDVVSFIISRSDRSFENIIHTVKKIDAASLKEKRRITLPFVKKILSL